MAEDLNIRDFTLDREDRKAVEAMDIGCSEIINHYSECTAKALNQAKFMNEQRKQLFGG